MRANALIVILGLLLLASVGGGEERLRRRGGSMLDWIANDWRAQVGDIMKEEDNKQMLRRFGLELGREYIFYWWK